MEKVDLVMVGAEGVAESGGIINKVEGLPVTTLKCVNSGYHNVAALLFSFTFK